MSTITEKTATLAVLTETTTGVSALVFRNGEGKIIAGPIAITIGFGGQGLVAESVMSATCLVLTRQGYEFTNYSPENQQVTGPVAKDTCEVLPDKVEYIR